MTRREVDRVLIPPVNEAFVAAAFYPEPESRPQFVQADLAFSDELVAELVDHDLLLISPPMHNFSVPSGLKVVAGVVGWNSVHGLVIPAADAGTFASHYV